MKLVQLNEYNKNPEYLIKKYAVLLLSLRDSRVDPAELQSYLDNPEWLDKAKEKYQLLVVSVKGDNIQYIKRPSDAIKLAAVKNKAHSIKYIKNPSDELQKTAIKRMASSLDVIKNPSDDVKWFAIKNMAKTIDYMDDPTDDMLLYLLDHPNSRWADKSYIGELSYARYISPKVMEVMIKRSEGGVGVIERNMKVVKSKTKPIPRALYDLHDELWGSS